MVWQPVPGTKRIMPARGGRWGAIVRRLIPDLQSVLYREHRLVAVEQTLSGSCRHIAKLDSKCQQEYRSALHTSLSCF
jgi:hypothetical protein